MRATGAFGHALLEYPRLFRLLNECAEPVHVGCRGLVPLVVLQGHLEDRGRPFLWRRA